MTLAPATFNVITAWVGVVCTLAIYSLLYRENPVYRLFEYIFLGVGAAYGFTRLYQDSLVNMWWVPLKSGQWWWMVPFLFGLLYFTIYIEKISWMARMLIGTLMGLAAGLQIQMVAVTYFPQITESFRPLQPYGVRMYDRLLNKPLTPPTALWGQVANNWVFVITLVSVMTYFFFSFEHRSKPVIGTARLGRWLLMISFGTVFGSTITARVALAVSRILFVIESVRAALHL